jgi:hypothetical protein
MNELTPELRDEILRIMRSSDIRHAMVFRDLEQGLTAEQVADRQHTSPENVRKLMKSVRHLLDGTLPTSSSMALTNSYVYRELMNFGPSPDLRAYADARLRALATHNPSVKIDEPLGPVTLYDSGTLARRATSKPDELCPACRLTRPCFCE